MRDPYQLCQTLLSSVVSEMTKLGSELPKTQYVAPGGTVAYDGEQVTTNVLRVFAGMPGAEESTSAQGFQVYSVSILICIVRDTPGLQDSIGGQAAIPSAAEIQKNAQLMLGDVQNLSQALINIIGSNVLGTMGMPVTIGPISTAGPEGGVVATTGEFAMPLL